MPVIGFSSDKAPCSVFPSLVGHPRHNAVPNLGGLAQSKHGILMLSYVVRHGMVVDWDGMEKVWHNMFHNKLEVAPDEHPLLLAGMHLSSAWWVVREGR